MKPTVFTGPSGDEVYLDLLQRVNDHGDEVAPRGQLTRELRDVTIQLDPRTAPPLAVRSNFNYGIAAVETAHVLAGVSSLAQLDQVSDGRFSRFADEGRLMGAYGPRLREQLARAEKRLREDEDTRQAIAVLWGRDEMVTRDVPCTLSLTFRIRHGRLELKTHMRSNDLILGVPYDWFVFTRLQLTMAECLGLDPGPYVHHVDSLHLYERDYDRAITMWRAARLVNAPKLGGVTAPEFTVSSIDQPVTGEVKRWPSWWHVQHAAQWVVQSDGDRRKSSTSWWATHVPVIEGQWECRLCRYLVPGPQNGRVLCDYCTE